MASAVIADESVSLGKKAKPQHHRLVSYSFKEKKKNRKQAQMH